MASTNKTSNLELNQWVGSDIPKRTDFNADNSIIDSVCGGHILDEVIHITEQERTKWNTIFATGRYTGSGQVQRTINLGYTPLAILIFAMDYPLGVDAANDCYSAFAIADVHAVGAAIVSNGVMVYNGAVNAVNGNTPKLNVSGVSYGYIAFK